MTTLTLDALAVLDAIERKGSFAAAAAALYRVPSAITYTVQKLEEDLGVVLFRREGRRSVLTPAGRVLLEQGRELLEAAERLAETTRQVHSGWESRLGIGLDSILDLNTLLPTLQRFSLEHQETEIDVREEVLGGSWEALLEGRVDLLVGASEAPPATAGLTLKPWRSVEWVFAVAPEHPLALSDVPLTQHQIAAHRGIVVRDSSRNLPPLTRRVFDQQPVLRVATLAQKINAQAAGLGAGYLPRHRIAALLEDGRLIAPALADPLPAAQTYLAWRRGERGRALRWFIEDLELHAREHDEREQDADTMQ